MFWKRDKPSPALVSASPAELPRLRGTLASHLTLWYAVPMSLLLLGVCLAMYFALGSVLRRETDHRLELEVKALRRLFANATTYDATLAHSIRLESEELEGSSGRGEDHASGRIFILRVLDSKGNVVAEPSPQASRLPAAMMPEPDLMGEDVSPEDRTLSDGGAFRVASVEVGPINDSFVVHLATDTRLEERLISKYRGQLLVTLGAGLILCLAVSYASARLAVRPVRQIAEAAERIGGSNLHQRIPIAGLPKELATLGAGFNAMLARLEDSFLRLSRFSAEIAHELRTPVAVLRGEMEVALLRGRTADDYRAVIESGLDETQRMQRLVDHLLFLARADNHEAVIHPEPLDLSEELEKIGEFLAVTAAESGVLLNVAAEPGTKVPLDKVLFQSAVGNLVENAISHTPSGGVVTLAAYGDIAGATVEVRDTGSGIAPEHLPFVCDRLYQVDPARSRRSGHVGLGLTLVKTIVGLHSGRLELESQLGYGTTATLWFPRSANGTQSPLS